MKLNLSVPVVPSKIKINLNDKLCFLGSCFSDEIGGRSIAHGLKSISNPFGTVFHPIPLARGIKNSILGLNNAEMFVHNRRVYDWDSSHLFHSATKDEHILNIQNSQKNLKKQLKGASWLFITLGTSMGYRHKQFNFIVANCHKQNQALFLKELVSIDEMYDSWSELLTELYVLNPQLNIVFTVSPVRHSKDGLINNNQSKSRLFVLIERLKENFPLSYFPSYEIIVDALRDYRFYKKDMIHPNEQAVDFVWAHFVKTYYTEINKDLIKRISKLKSAENHQIMNPDEIEGEKLKKWILEERNKLNEEIGGNFNL